MQARLRGLWADGLPLLAPHRRRREGGQKEHARLSVLLSRSLRPRPLGKFGVGWALAFTVLTAGEALAQSQGLGTLTGTVVDASTHLPIGDVVVTATSPRLQGEQVAVTDATGSYRIPQLPPGDYSLRFEKELFEPTSLVAIAVEADRTLRLNVQLTPGGAPSREAVVIACGGPMIDVSSAQIGLTLASNFFQNVPIAPASSVAGSRHTTPRQSLRFLPIHRHTHRWPDPRRGLQRTFRCADFGTRP